MSLINLKPFFSGFKRLEKKRNLDFHVLKQTFQKNGINDEEKAQKSKQQLLKNAKNQALIVIIFSASLSLIAKNYAPTILVFTIIAIAYIGIFTYRGRICIQRYIDEVINHPKYNPETGLVDEVESPETENETKKESQD